MSGKREKAKRRAVRELPEVVKNADFALAAARRVLAADISHIRLTRVTQFVLGWMRAAFDQSRVIATLTKGGLAAAASPNRRSFAEIAVRLQWLHATSQDERVTMLDAMFEHERELTEKATEHLRKMGFESQRDLTEMRDFVLDAAEGARKDEARRFLAAAQSTDGQSVGLYYAWREETQYTHATGAMAVAYAPKSGDDRFPPVADADLKSHLYSLFLVISLVNALLADEGVSKSDTEVIIDAFLGL